MIPYPEAPKTLPFSPKGRSQHFLPVPTLPENPEHFVPVPILPETGFQEAGSGSCAIEANRITFVGVLSTWLHTDLVDYGCYYFDSMSREHGINPSMEHYACMVEFLGHVRLLKAIYFFMVMTFMPGTVVLCTSLGAYKIYGNTELVIMAIQSWSAPFRD